jgi:hypothetical protein
MVREKLLPSLETTTREAYNDVGENVPRNNVFTEHGS